MKKNFYYDNDEIDLIAIFKILLNSKIKILLIVTVSFLIGQLYLISLPNNKIISLNMKPSNNNEFAKLLFIYGSFETPILDPTKHKEQIGQTMFKRFIYELQDYEEFLFNLKNLKTVKENISKLDIDFQKKELFKFTKLFEVNGQERDKSNLVRFTWGDAQEGLDIIQKTINLTLINLRKSIFNELYSNLELEKKRIITNDKLRLDYLSEQSAIAKELNISDNQVDSVNISQSSVSLNINTADIAYYLRGYKAIDKEIELLQNRTYQKFDIIKQEIDSLKKDSINWIVYNIYLAEIQNTKNEKMVLWVSTLLGLFFGIFYVLTFNSAKSKTISKKKN